MADGFLKVGITCYPSVGGSGILASELGTQLAERGHEVHFISYERPFRLPDSPRVFFHAVQVNQYELFRFPDYTLPLSVKLAEVTRDHGLNILHAHYAVPHATAAILARDMLPRAQRPRVITTLHGTDTTLLGRDTGYGPAIRHALEQSDAVTAVSAFLRNETQRLLDFHGPLDVIPNFFQPREPRRSRAEVRAQLGVGDGVLLLHLSNLRPLKRIDLLLATFARIRKLDTCRLLILAGGDFRPYQAQMRELGLEGRIVIRENVVDIEDYLQAADIGLFTSASESFCLSLLEAMAFGCPSVTTAVGGIPEVVAHGVDGLLVESADAADLASAVDSLVENPSRRALLGAAARTKAREVFSAGRVVPQYIDLYRRTLAR